MENSSGTASVFKASLTEHWNQDPLALLQAYWVIFSREKAQECEFSPGVPGNSFIQQCLRNICKVLYPLKMWSTAASVSLGEVGNAESKVPPRSAEAEFAFYQDFQVVHSSLRSIVWPTGPKIHYRVKRKWRQVSTFRWEYSRTRGKSKTISLIMTRQVSKLWQAKGWKRCHTVPMVYSSKMCILIKSGFLLGFVLISFHIYAKLLKIRNSDCKSP